MLSENFPPHNKQYYYCSSLHALTNILSAMKIHTLAHTHTHTRTHTHTHDTHAHIHTCNHTINLQHIMPNILGIQGSMSEHTCLDLLLFLIQKILSPPMGWPPMGKNQKKIFFSIFGIRMTQFAKKKQKKNSNFLTQKILSPPLGWPPMGKNQKKNRFLASEWHN